MPQTIVICALCARDMLGKAERGSLTSRSSRHITHRQVHITNAKRSISRAARRYITSLCLTVSDKRHLLFFREKYSRWDICSSRAEGVTRYVESVPRSRLMASPALDMTQLAFVCKHPRRDWSVALRLSYSRVRQTTLSTWVKTPKGLKIGQKWGL